jgi:hypothetical protein
MTQLTGHAIGAWRQLAGLAQDAVRDISPVEPESRVAGYA